jgi:hypothetical protein
MKFSPAHARQMAESGGFNPLCCRRASSVDGGELAKRAEHESFRRPDENSPEQTRRRVIRSTAAADALSATRVYIDRHCAI